MKPILDTTMHPTIIGAGGLTATAIADHVTHGLGLMVALSTVLFQAVAFFRSLKKSK